MPRAITGYILIVLLTVGAVPAAAAPTVAEQVAHLKAGQNIKVELSSGEMLKGRLGLVTTGQFTMEPRSAAQGAARVVPFDQARSVERDGLTRGAKWAIFGLVWVVVGIVGKLTV